MPSSAELRILRAMVAGWTLKDHRDLDGNKRCVLHSLEGKAEPVDRDAVAALVEHGLIGSNQKFPAATYWLTPAGRLALEDSA
jgi:hypothetical protein